MPAALDRRQPDAPADAWFGREPTLRLVQEVQRQAIPDLTRVFGHSGLYLRPGEGVPAMLSGNLLAQVPALKRDGNGFSGDLRCRDDGIPFASGSLSLVYALFVLETSPDPAALLAEVARVLKPEGVLMVLSFNPWSPVRLRWAFRGLRPVEPGWLQQRVAEAGLEVHRQRHLGPLWAARGDGRAGRAALAPPALRAAHLLVARRREPGITPLLGGLPAGLALRPGMSAG